MVAPPAAPTTTLPPAPEAAPGEETLDLGGEWCGWVAGAEGWRGWDFEG